MVERSATGPSVSVYCTSKVMLFLLNYIGHKYICSVVFKNNVTLRFGVFDCRTG